MLPLVSTHYDAEHRIWSGAKRKDLYNENITLGEVIYDKLLKNPKKVIQIHDVTGEEMTCEELLQNAQILAKQLLQIGLEGDDIIGLYAGNSNHVVTIMLASFLCGNPVNPVYAEFDKETLITIFNVTRPKIIFCEVQNYANAVYVSQELKLLSQIIVINGIIEGVMSIENLLKSGKAPTTEDTNFRYPCLDLNGDDTALIVCSSGTTGPPKGVLCSHRMALNQECLSNLNKDSILFGFSPMYWISGFWALKTSLLNTCLRIVTDKAFSPDYFLDLVRRRKISHVLLNASHAAEVSLMEDKIFVQECLTDIDTIVTGGSKVPLIVQEKMAHILSNNPNRPGFLVAYGMSELGGLMSMNGACPNRQLLGSEGQLVANRKVRIINKQGRPLGPNEQGEICVSTPHRWRGYYKNEKATRKALVDNWLYTGDIGYFDDGGFLHFCTRGNDVFKSRNFQIYPQILEELLTKVSGIFEACIVGIPHVVDTHLIAAAVVRTTDRKGRELTAKKIEDHVLANIGKMYHLSGGIYFLETIPKTPTGKIQRRKVLEIVLEMSNK